MQPFLVSVRWADLPPHNQWPHRIVVWLHVWTLFPCHRERLRSVRTRRAISGIIGTDRWLWTGPRTITATLG